jgi:hypothetical protein
VGFVTPADLERVEDACELAFDRVCEPGQLTVSDVRRIVVERRRRRHRQRFPV